MCEMTLDLGVISKLVSDPLKWKTRQKESKSELWPDFEHRCEEVKPGCSVFFFLLCEEKETRGMLFKSVAILK